MSRRDPPINHGWLGHRGIPRPAVVRREHRRTHIDWLDCLLAIWIAEAMLQQEPPARPAKQQPTGPGTVSLST